MSRKRVLHVVTNVGAYDDARHPTGLWLSELTHAWEVFEHAGYDQRIVSPAGGASPLEPRSLRWPSADASTRTWQASPEAMDRLEHTLAPAEVDPDSVDAIYFTGGHAVMYDFPCSCGLQDLTREVFESGRVVSSVCHGYCGLLRTRLSDSSLLISGRRITGFSWREEVLAGVARLVPYNAQQAALDAGADYRKGLLPFASHVEVDGRLITGQNPGSARATAQAVVRVLESLPAAL